MNELQDLANQCRHANLGYCDGKPGTVDDIKERIKQLEYLLRISDKSRSFLLRKVEKLSEK